MDIDLNNAINFLGNFSYAWLNDSNDIVLCNFLNNHCKDIYYLDLDEEPIKLKRVPTCAERSKVYIWGFSLCNGRDKILFPLSIFTGDRYEMGVVEYDKKSGKVSRIKTPEGIYSAEDLSCPDDNIFVYQDVPPYRDCTGMEHVVSYFFYFNREEKIHKRIRLPIGQTIMEENGEKFYFERDLPYMPYVWGEYVIYTSPLWEEDEYKAKNCIWRYNVYTDTREAFFCSEYLHSDYTWFPASRFNEYRIALTIYSEITGYPPGVLIINVKSGEIRHIPMKHPRHAVILFKNLMMFWDEGVPYIYDFDTGIKRMINVELEYFMYGEHMNSKYLLSVLYGYLWYLIDLEKLGVVKDGHVVPE